jgi:hypothetical protein
MDNKSLFVEESIINAVKKLLSGRVNELLGEVEYPIPPIEFSPLLGGGSMSPVIRLSEGERTEKDRIIQIDVYSLTITFAVAEGLEAERHCYAYALAVDLALAEDSTFGGIVDWAALTGKKYIRPKTEYSGEDWGVVLSFRITVKFLEAAILGGREGKLC